MLKIQKRVNLFNLSNYSGQRFLYLSYGAELDHFSLGREINMEERHPALVEKIPMHSGQIWFPLNLIWFDLVSIEFDSIVLLIW